MSLDAVIPVTRNWFLPLLLRSFERAGAPNGFRVLLVTNDLHELNGRFDFPIGLVRFTSQTQYYGPNALPIQYNAGAWAAGAENILFWDDDQLAPGGLFNSVLDLLERRPICFGNYRFVNFGEFTPEALAHASSSLGISREKPPNHNHGFWSTAAGLIGCKKEFFWMVGGFDHIFSGARTTFDQHFGHRVSLALGDGGRIFVHEPPFAWHPTEATRLQGAITPSGNGCASLHQLSPEELDVSGVRLAF